MAAEARGNWAEAERAYRQALLAGGPTAETCFNLANVLYSLGQYARSGERYRQVVELDPDFWEAWNNLGTVLSYDSDNEAAVAAYDRAWRSILATPTRITTWPTRWKTWAGWRKPASTG